MKTLFNWLLNFMLSRGTLFFAAAAVVPDVSSGNEAPPVQDSTQSDGVQDDTSPSDSPIQDGEKLGDSAVDERVDPTSQKADAKVDGRALPPKVREMMDALKASDPKAHGFLKDVLFRDRAFRQEFPGGIAEAKQLKASLGELGEGGIEAIKSERAEWNQIDEAYNAADPRFIDIMVDANPESFKKLGPSLIEKFAAVDGEGYQRHMAGVFMATMQGANVLGTLNFASRLLAKGDAEGAAAELKAITDWVGGIDQLAKSQPKAPEKAPELDQREKDLQAREDQQWANQTAGEVNTFKTSAIKKELSQYLKGQQLDDETYEAIEGQALKYLNSLLMADPKFMPTFKAYCDNKDTEGVSKYMKSRLQELLPSKNGKPGPVEKAYKLFFRGGATPPAKPRPAAGGKPGATPAAQVPQGWAKVAKAPAPHEIDMRQSPFEMRFKQAAVLKSGKRVFWGANAPN